MYNRNFLLFCFCKWYATNFLYHYVVFHDSLPIDVFILTETSVMIIVLQKLIVKINKGLVKVNIFSPVRLVCLKGSFCKVWRVFFQVATSLNIVVAIPQYSPIPNLWREGNVKFLTFCFLFWTLFSLEKGVKFKNQIEIMYVKQKLNIQK